MPSKNVVNNYHTILNVKADNGSQLNLLPYTL